MSAKIPVARSLAVVTGASTGIGYELAREFIAHGYDVIIAADEDRIHDAARQLNTSGDARASAVQTDLTTYDGVERLWAVIQDTGRPVAALALNAGIGAGGSFVSNDPDAELRVVKLNVVSPVHLARRIIPTMVAHGTGRVLITSSVSATMPAPFAATYAASKSFLLSFALAIRAELKDTGVTVTALMPGPTETELFERSGMQDTRVGAMERKDDPAQVAREAYEGLMRGDDRVIPGRVRNQLLVATTRAMPEAAKVALHRQLTEPQSDDKS
jgi:short-subunit dehydrogenase